MELIGISDTRQPQKTNQRSCDGLGGVLRSQPLCGNEQMFGAKQQVPHGEQCY